MSITISPFRSPGLNRKSGLPTQHSSQQPFPCANGGDTFKKAGHGASVAKSSQPLFGGAVLSTLLEPTPGDDVWTAAYTGKGYDVLEKNLSRAFYGLRFSEDRNWSGRSLTMEAIRNGNYEVALMIASWGGDPDEEYDRDGRNTLDYVDARSDLTNAGKEQLKHHLVNLFKMCTEVYDHPDLETSRKNIPDFVRELPRKSGH